MTGHVPRLTIRPERPADIPWIRALNEQAFGQPDEVALVDAVRARGEQSISLVAVGGARLVGHILFTPVTIRGPDCVHEAVGLAPTPNAQAVACLHVFVYGFMHGN